MLGVVARITVGGLGEVVEGIYWWVMYGICEWMNGRVGDGRGCWV